MKNIFYFKKISSCGGVESWFWYLSKLYKNMVVYYKEASAEQVKRLAKNIEVIKYTDQQLECDNFFCNYNPDILDNVKAKNYINMIHCDYKQVLFSPNSDERFNINIAVSKLAGESFKEITGKDYELIYNPIAIDKPKVEKYNDGKLHLISATRLAKEKGLNRMIKLAKILDKTGIDYEWVVYTNRKRQTIGNKVIYKDNKLDIIEDIAKADYLVQLSDCEAFCYSVVEALYVGTPVIVTDLPVFKEIGVNKDNAIICDMEMTNFHIEDLFKEHKFSYEPPKSNWGKYLSGNSSYNPNELIEVRTIKKIYLVEENEHHDRNKIIKLRKSRVSELECKGMVERI